MITFLIVIAIFLIALGVPLILLLFMQKMSRDQAAFNGKLDVIHILVNSNMTAAMQAEYDATFRELAMMREVMELKKNAGLEPTLDVLTAINATQVKLAELAVALQDRKTII